MSAVLRSARALLAGLVMALPLLLGPLASPATADDLLRMSARVLLQGHTRVGSWMAVEVQLANDGPPIVGELRLDAVQAGARYSMAVDLPTSSRKTYVLHAQPPVFGRNLTLNLVVNRATVQTLSVPYQVHNADQIVIGVVAERPQGITTKLAIRSNTGVVSFAATLGPGDLPDQVEGWAPLDALIWQDTDSNELSAAQLTALRAWLAGGGRMVIVGGTAGIGTLSGFPDDILPYRPTASLEIDPAAVAAIVGTPLTGVADVTAMAGSLVRGHALASVGDRAVAAVAPYGSGSVAIVGFDPSARWLADGQAAATMWRSLIPQRTANGTVIFDDSQLLQGVISLPSLALPPIGGLLLLLAGYIVVIGPLNYLVLRRLDRRELAWLTMPVLIVGFAAGAYAYGAALRGTDIVVNELAIVRGAPDATEGSAQAYFGVFSPTRGTYQVDVPGGALLAAPLTPDAIGGSSSGPLDVLQGDPSTVRDLSIGFGSLRVVRAETTAAVPRMRADLHLVDAVLTGTLENASDQTLERVAVVLGGSVTTLGDVKPHTSVPVKLRLTGTSQDRSLADVVVGQFNAGPVAVSEDLTRQAARYQMVQQLAYDPQMGWGNRLPGERPIILAFGRSPVLDVKVQGQETRRASNVMYYVPAEMTIQGQVAFGGDLIRSTVVAVDNPGFFNKDPFNTYMGAGTMTSAYQPIDFTGEFDLSAIRMVLSNGSNFPPNAGKPIAPLPTLPELCTDLTNTKPEGCTPRRVDMLPEVELFDVQKGDWVRLPALSLNASYSLEDPARYYNPTGRQVLVRFVNPDPQNQIAFSFQLVMAGLVR